MTLQEFNNSLESPTEPKEIGPFLLALWHDAKGKWEEAHSIVQEVDHPDGAWIHAYIEKKGMSSMQSSGIISPAENFLKLSLEAEWEEIARYLISLNK